jgi:hypothetical protein
MAFRIMGELVEEEVDEDDVDDDVCLPTNI